MKRTVALMLTLACCLSLMGCGEKEKAENSTTASTGTPTYAASAPATQGASTPATQGASANPTQGASAPATQGSSQSPSQQPTTAPSAGTTQPVATSQSPSQPHTEHSFGEWVVKTSASCLNEGREERRCTGCNATESRTIPVSDHKFNAQNVCTKCYLVNFDDKASLVELGVVVDTKYGSGSVANKVWDIQVWNGKVYRAAGDYDKNSGATTIFAYDIANKRWIKTGTVADEAIHGFEVIGGRLVAPGIDATAGWNYGNYYILQEDGTWKQMRNLPNGVHCFDMIECGDKVFAGLGTEKMGNIVAVSQDGGNTFSFVPLYKDGAPYDVSSFSVSRVYEFVQLEGKVYALAYFKTKTGYNRWAIFGYEDGKMHYLADGTKLIERSSFSRKYFGGGFEFNGKCYITVRGLYAIDDFTDPAKWNTISMPNNGKVSDAILWDGAIYVLTSRQDSKTKLYHTIIYKSTTGEKGSFEEVASYDYGGFPMSFDYDGKHFYVGTGLNDIDKSKLGMVLRVTPNAQ